MNSLTINGVKYHYQGNPEESLLNYLRLELRITSPKDGCSGQGVCGACTVEVDGKPKLACRVKMKDVEGCNIYTTEGLPEDFRQIIGSAFAQKGAVQCGFCSPGFIMRAKVLYNQNPLPSRNEIIKAIHPNICRCTGYVKIIDAIESAMDRLQEPASHEMEKPSGSIGSRLPKYQAFETALGTRPFVDDMHFEGMLHAALKFTDYPRAVVLSIHTANALHSEGVVDIFTKEDIPGDPFSGLIFKDWPMMIGKGETTHCIGDVLAVVVASSEALACAALNKIEVAYEPLNPVTDLHEAVKPDCAQVHKGRSNILETCSIQFGDIEKAFADAAYTASGIFETQRIEHAFLETETAIALPEDDGIRLFTQGQGAYVDQKLIAGILGLPIKSVKVEQVQNGGGFGGKEDLTVQPHAALCALLLKKTVRVHLTRAESIIMHPKRHPVWMDIQLACDQKGQFTALRLNAMGDTGAYASVGTKVLERVVGHATGGYTVPAVDIRADTVYTNNIPSGAMRGFGVPQVVFAMESCIDELCVQGGFDRWQIRYDNALVEGSKTATGQRLQGVGLRKTLLAVKDQFQKARFAGIACGLKNTGVGNGMIDDSEVKIEILNATKVVIHHGWSEMGQGVHSIARQVVFEETGIDPEIIDVVINTDANLPTGMTTSSRASALVGNALIDASRRLKNDLKTLTLDQLAGKVYKGKYVCDFTCKPGSETENPIIHFAYGYATQVVILNETGHITKVIAAHDAGKILNQMLFEGQIEGAVHMGLGYALTEELGLREGWPTSLKYKDLGVLRASEMPEIEVIGIEESDFYGPYGAKGIGEIGLVPTAAAVANAFRAFDGMQRMKLPLKKKITKKE
ncbi:MAG: selenium-dependent xanthine dehydrogenase [Bacteroidetes bacterium HGW-Bacteroidetes-1]|jgi:selenium-dependent xanthine dehydrogenase|nr:MAG: selenium-dependent xanthine dehydrogenase [Bacteroidetes bacterium HGW-Bacteroidetes-1]